MLNSAVNGLAVNCGLALLLYIASKGILYTIQCQKVYSTRSPCLSRSEFAGVLPMEKTKDMQYKTNEQDKTIALAAEAYQKAGLDVGREVPESVESARSSHSVLR